MGFFGFEVESIPLGSWLADSEIIAKKRLNLGQAFKQKPEPTRVILIEKIGSNLVATKTSCFATPLRGLNLNTSCYLLGVRAAETRSNRNPNQQ